MMILLKYLSSNYVMLAALVGLWFLLYVSVHLTRRMVRMARVSTLLLVLTTVMVHVEGRTQGFEQLSVWRVILNEALFMIYPCMMIFVIQIIAPIKKNFWLNFPALINIPICFTTQYTHLICYYTEDNTYHPGLIPYLPHCIFAFYLVLFLVQCIRYGAAKTGKDRFVIIYIFLTSVIGSFFGALAGNNEIYCKLFAVELMLYYLFIYIEMAKSDTLTGLMNRQSFMKDTSQDFNRITAMVSVDMNELKWINDSQGHSAGDEALRSVANALAEGLKSQGRLYRTGGDEFMITFVNKAQEPVEDSVRVMRAAVEKTGHTCAFGIGYKEPDSTMDSLISAADKAMYKDKSRIKRAILESGGALHRRHDDFGR